MLNKISAQFIKHKPEVMVCAGVGGMVVAAGLACRSTVKAMDIIQRHKTDMKAINDAKEIVANDETGTYTYDKKDIYRDIFVTYSKTAGSLVLAYLPTIILIGASAAAIFYGHKLRYAQCIASAAAYAGIEKAYSEYRNRVIDMYGSNINDQIRYGYHESEDVFVDPESGEVTERQPKAGIDIAQCSPYARIFDKTNINWDVDGEFNSSFLKKTQMYWNDKLKTRGHVFLNEVYESLGFDHTPEGSIVGWVWRPNDPTSYVDFGTKSPGKFSNREVIEQFDHDLVLDFNIDGIIYDLL